MRLYLVRHGRASAGWDTHVDPGLDELGRRQAAALCTRLEAFGPLPIVTSPMLRCRETAAPLADAWSCVPTIEPAVGEIPSPEGVSMGDRVEWLRWAMRSTWTELGPRYTEYRAGVTAALRAAARDPAASVCGAAVVVSHFVAINAAVGAAIGDDRVLIHRLDNCSVTMLDVVPDDTLEHAGEASPGAAIFRLVEAGHEADTQIR